MVIAAISYEFTAKTVHYLQVQIFALLHRDEGIFTHLKHGGYFRISQPNKHIGFFAYVFISYLAHQPKLVSIVIRGRPQSRILSHNSTLSTF